jgi:division protein CdvB (Snf7/Vps24/ESCRT-III family)
LPDKFAKKWGTQETSGQLRYHLDAAIKGIESKLEVKSEEAKKILMEASIVANQKMKEKENREKDLNQLK